METLDLLKKYDIPVPRYTSYPAVPHWNDSPTIEEWTESVEKSLQPPHAAWAIYLHIPFCESLCSYCGCNTFITKDHQWEEKYLEYVLKEWEMYLNSCPSLRSTPLSQLHIGGGTPTFFSSKNLKRLLASILDQVQVSSGCFDASVEVAPKVTTVEHLKVLRDLGFTRLSIGVQDFDASVLEAVNRTQTTQSIEHLVSEARSLGFTSINFDFIYGLPGQTIESMSRTMDKTLKFRPDRIALYSLAVVPNVKPGHRKISRMDRSQGSTKYKLYQVAAEKLMEGGYCQLGMDHFALPDDELTLTSDRGELHRNFMGYTEVKTDLLLGLGVSAISESEMGYYQNKKDLKEYLGDLEDGSLPMFRGHKLSSEERERRALILSLMTEWKIQLENYDNLEFQLSRLDPFFEDELISIYNDHLLVTEKGKPFIRNICSSFDPYYAGSEGNTFSRSI